jgi:hypothetical protein
MEGYFCDIKSFSGLETVMINKQLLNDTSVVCVVVVVILTIA